MYLIKFKISQIIIINITNEWHSECKKNFNKLRVVVENISDFG